MTMIDVFLFMSVGCAVCANRVYTDFDNTQFEPGEKISMKWRFELAAGNDMLSMICGKKNESAPQASVDESTDIITLAEMRNDALTPQFNLANPFPRSYAGRVRIEEKTTTGMMLVIDPLRASDVGRYFCLLKFYDGMLLQTITIRSLLETLSNAETGSRSDISKDQITILAIVFAVLGAIVVVIVIGVMFYRRKTHGNKKNWTVASNKKNSKEKEKLRSSISYPGNSPKANENGSNIEYAKVQIVRTPEEALNGTRVVYIDDTDTGFV